MITIKYKYYYFFTCNVMSFNDFADLELLDVNDTYFLLVTMTAYFVRK